MPTTSSNRDRRSVPFTYLQRQHALKRRHTLVRTAAVALVGASLIAAAAVPIFRLNQVASPTLTEIGVRISGANCFTPPGKSASGNNDHVSTGQTVNYLDAPPAFGPHADTPQPMTRKFFTTVDRPRLEMLVHNLEHGFTILWYDQSVADNPKQRQEVEAITQQFPATSGLEGKFFAAPWTAADGAAFPDGAHIALSHWSNGGTNGNPDAQTGAWMYCSRPSGGAVAEFVDLYPFSDAPEGWAPG